MPVCGSGAVVCSSSLLFNSNLARCRPEAPLIDLCKFPEPALFGGGNTVGTDIGIWDIETGGDIGAEVADFAARVHRRDRACLANPPECRTIHATGKSTPELGTAWLTTQSTANPSAEEFPCFTGKKQGN